MNIAYLSPFNPQRSGISDFSEELVMKLKDIEGFIIDIFVDGYEPSNKDSLKGIKVFNIDELYKARIRENYQCIIYEVGNCKEYHKKIVETFLELGGILELHDVSLFDYQTQVTINENKDRDFIDLMEYCHGEEGREVARKILSGAIKERWGDLPQKFLLNKTLIDRADAVIVHSDYARQVVKRIRPDVIVQKIMHHTADIVDDYKKFYKSCRKKLDIPEDRFVISTFGFAHKAKRVDAVLEALKIYNSRNAEKIYYYIVGDADKKELEKKIKEYDLGKYVKITGYTELEEFKTYMGACDIVLNLRYPTLGESSGSMHRALGMGKAIMVTNVGSYMEFPDDTVFKVSYDENEVQDIVNILEKLMKNKEALSLYQENAYNFAKKHCNLDINVNMYKAFLYQMLYSTPRDNNYFEEEDIIVDKMFELGLTDEEFVNKMCEKIEFFKRKI